MEELRDPTHPIERLAGRNEPTPDSRASAQHQAQSQDLAAAVSHVTWPLTSLSADASQSCSLSVSPNLSLGALPRVVQGLQPNLPQAEPGQPLWATSSTAADAPFLGSSCPRSGSSPHQCRPTQETISHRLPRNPGKGAPQNTNPSVFFKKSADTQHMGQTLADELNRIRNVSKPKHQTMPLKYCRPNWAPTWITHPALTYKSTSHAP